MRFDIEHGIEALYQVAAEGVYQEHKFSTIRRGFVIDTQLIKLNRTANCINDDTIVIDNALFKKSFIKNEEIITDEFKKLKKAINDNYIGMAVIID